MEGDAGVTHITWSHTSPLALHVPSSLILRRWPLPEFTRLGGGFEVRLVCGMWTLLVMVNDNFR